jgi:protein-S-isoprenylcysteine O-methyltransferase Ste14
MILAWTLFVVVRFVVDLLVVLLVPPVHRITYGCSEKDRAYYLAHLLSNAIPTVAGLQSFLYPQYQPLSARLTGAVLMFFGGLLVVLAWRSNPYFQPAIVKIPAHDLVHTGVYRIFRHPGYIGMAINTIGQVLLLGQKWACLPATCYLGLLVWRADQENYKVLR